MRTAFLILLTLVWSAYSLNSYYREGGLAASAAESPGPASNNALCADPDIIATESYSPSDTLFITMLGDSIVTAIVFPSSGSPGNYIVIKNAPGEEVWFNADSARSFCIQINDKDYIRIDSLNFTRAINLNLKVTGGCDSIIVSNCMFTRSGNEGAGQLLGSAMESWYCTFRDNTSDGVTVHDSSQFGDYYGLFANNGDMGVNGSANAVVRLHNSRIDSCEEAARMTNTVYFYAENCTTDLGLYSFNIGTTRPCTLNNIVCYRATGSSIYHGGASRLIIDGLYVQDQSGESYAVNQNDAACSTTVYHFKIIDCPNGFLFRGNFNISTGFIHKGGRAFNQVSAASTTFGNIENVWIDSTSTYPIEQNGAYLMVVNSAVFAGCASDFYATGATFTSNISTRNDVPIGSGNIRAAGLDTLYKSVKWEEDTFAMPILNEPSDTGGVDPALTTTDINGVAWYGFPIGPATGGTVDPPVLDSISPAKGKRSITNITYYVSNQPDSTAGTFAKMNNVTMSALSQFSSGKIKVKPPAWMPPGRYTNIWFGDGNGGDTLRYDTLNSGSFRLLVPEAGAP